MERWYYSHAQVGADPELVQAPGWSSEHVSLYMQINMGNEILELSGYIFTTEWEAWELMVGLDRKNSHGSLIFSHSPLFGLWSELREGVGEGIIHVFFWYVGFNMENHIIIPLHQLPSTKRGLNGFDLRCLG